jgi:outer membrane protein OmpA-like peptidoglycan-associated protein
MRLKSFLFLMFVLISVYSFSDVFYVFSNSPKEKNFYTPTGYMGDVSDINISADYNVLAPNGYPSLKLRYIPRGEQKWIGVYFRNPSDNWGQVKGGYDLTGAKKLVFYARGEKGGEMISSVGCGGIKGTYPDSDIFQIGPIRLSKEWKKFTLDLSGKDLSYIAGGFFFIIETKDNPLGCIIYFGDIYYEGEEIKAAEIYSDKTPPTISFNMWPKKVEVSTYQATIEVNFDISCDDNKSVEEWKIEVLNEQGKPVKKFSGSGKTKKVLTWDGLDEVYGKLVPEGIYKVVFTAKDHVGNVSTKEEEVLTINRLQQVQEVVKEVPKEIKISEDEKFIRVQIQSQVLFEFGKYNLMPQSKKILQNVVELLKAYPKNKILVEGHTDSVGSDEYNLKLSKLRAEEVKKFLVENGIEEERIESKGYGKSKPIASNKTQQGRALNRRVEILIVK